MIAAVVVSEQRARHRRTVSSYSTRSHHDSLRSGDVYDIIKGWSVSQVSKFMKRMGYDKHVERFVEHQVDGIVLLSLTTEMLRDIGITQPADHVAITSTVEFLSKLALKLDSQDLKVPSWASAQFQFFSFAWAETSEGKSASEMKEEIQVANLSLTLIGALMTSVLFSFFFGLGPTCYCPATPGTTCFCSTPFDIESDAVWAFYLITGIGALSFLGATIFSVIQIVAVNEMSDDGEVMRFLDMLGPLESLPGKLVAAGIFATEVAMLVYTAGNVLLGFESNTVWPAVTMFTLTSIFLYAMNYAMARMIRCVYQAKLEVANRKATVEEDPRFTSIRDVVVELQEKARKRRRRKKSHKHKSKPKSNKLDIDI